MIPLRASTNAAVPSREPSSTTRISVTGIGERRAYAAIRSSVAGRRCSSLYAGMTIESVSNSAALIKIPLVSRFEALPQRRTRLPAEGGEPRYIEEFARRSVGLRRIPDDVPFESDDRTDGFGQFRNGQI